MKNCFIHPNMGGGELYIKI